MMQQPGNVDDTRRLAATNDPGVLVHPQRAPKAWVPRDKPVGAVPAHGKCVSSVPNRATPNSEAASTQVALSSSSETRK